MLLPEVMASWVPSGDHTAEVALLSIFSRIGGAVFSALTTQTPPAMKAIRLLSGAQSE